MDSVSENSSDSFSIPRLLYPLSIYYIVLQADETIALRDYEREIIKGHIAYVCWRMKSRLINMRFIGDQMHAIVELSCDETLSQLLSSLTSLKLEWRAGNNEVKWCDKYRIATISPEDSSAAEKHLLDADHKLSIPERKVSSNLHHIILITHEGHVTMPTGYRQLFCDAMIEVCCSIGGNMISTMAMRNHVHLLCELPIDKSLRENIQLIKDKILQWMHSNRHFRRMPGWSGETWAYTVGLSRKAQEDRMICLQDEYHRLKIVGNEMAFLSRRLGYCYGITLQ